MSIEVSLEGGDDITEKYLHCVYDVVVVDIPLYVDGRPNKDFALLYYELDWACNRFDELASDQLKKIYNLIIEFHSIFYINKMLDDVSGIESDELSVYLDKIKDMADKDNEKHPYEEDRDDFDVYLGIEPAKDGWAFQSSDDSNPHGFDEVQIRIMEFLENVPSKVYSLNFIVEGVRLDSDDVFYAVNKLLRGGYLANDIDPDAGKKQYTLTGKHLIVPGNKSLPKHPLAIKPRKFEDFGLWEVKEKIAKYLFHSKKPVGTVIDLAERLSMNLRDVQLTLKNLIEEGVVNSGDTYALSAGYLKRLESLSRKSDGTLEKYCLD